MDEVRAQADPRPPQADPRPPQADPRPPQADPRPPQADPHPPSADPRPPQADPHPPSADPRPPQAALYDLRVTVERIEGRSVCGMRVGDWFELAESSHLRTCPGRFFCVYALAAVLPLLAAKQRELSPGDWLEHDNLVACPDPDERLIMRIERTGRSTIALNDVT